jgi:hypothetical protein
MFPVEQTPLIAQLQPLLDPVSVATAVIAALLGNALGQVLGPYAIIAIAATVGAGWSLSRNPSSSARGAVLFVLRMTATALLLSWGAAEFGHAYWPTMPIGLLLVPIALGIGAVGDDWPALIRWCGVRIFSVIDRGRRIEGENER